MFSGAQVVQWRNYVHCYVRTVTQPIVRQCYFRVVCLLLYNWVLFDVCVSMCLLMLPVVVPITDLIYSIVVLDWETSYVLAHQWNKMYVSGMYRFEMKTKRCENTDTDWAKRCRCTYNNLLPINFKQY